MRRLTAIPVKASAVAVLIMAGAAYTAAEARQAVIRRQRLEIARIEDVTPNPETFTPETATKPSPDTITAIPAKPDLRSQDLRSQYLRSTDLHSTNLRSNNDEQAAERQAANLPAQKPTASRDGHTRRIVISIHDRRLALLEDGKLVKSYRIAVGAKISPSPDGEFAVINHAVRPTYRHAGKEILPGKDNPLGTRWIGLSLKGYGIHGTNVPSSIGKAASHGCFRMGQTDVEDLYSRVQVGDTVIVRREHDELIAQIFDAPASATIVANQMVARAAAQNDNQIATAAAGNPSPAIQGQP